ncbi:MAG: UDP-N-acetylmuramoyl-L-alanyl-D-glutamate--2,6-diaminopimelate ligase [Peptoniphilaceae bacterium]|nr:UDP-N-acetylmuramoyl-L-alanyl-D-glutamate--2,6-diaminopimelate ligase [Peptoniphilaceae bacterium]MDD7383830.1 UDP-N-acetylmuramoyl-L-alanyl-D-glutamate--2,6-diaminopimelate ligase [Peptoniphilaceae bacterium]MDY3737593.1 UDP-N-acetylmuramoyl-L-alanyl-D-glutamate--2,6-diaminopimelate ligase [Peptoniphilaceae bacterium]
MKIKDFISDIDFIEKKIYDNEDIKNVTSDSRDVRENYAFVAIKGYEVDGHKFIDNAIKNGAKLIVYTEEIDFREDISYIKVEDARKALAQVSNIITNNPSKSQLLFGITGTNGKTTVSSMIFFLLKYFKGKSVMIGTNGSYYGSKNDDKWINTNNTTPEVNEINDILKKGLDEGYKNAVIEASSHALYLKRVYGFDFDYGIFNNLSEEHLDFHETMENYFDAKMLLLEMSKKKVVNFDDIYGKKAKERFKDAITFGSSDSDYNISDIKIKDDKLLFKINSVDFKLNTIAKFNAYNALAAVAVLNDMGYSLYELSKALEKFKGVKARFEYLENPFGFNIILDFAHTPKSFDELLKAVPKGHKIYAVYGLNGTRTYENRKAMGEIAAKNKVFSIVTMDDPKFDTAEQIASDIVDGIKENNGEYVVNINRKEAQRYAIDHAQKGDYILLVGKGDEDFLKIIGNNKIPFSERGLLKEVIDEKCKELQS